MTPRARKSTRELNYFCKYSWGYGQNKTSNKPYNFVVIHVGCKVYSFKCIFSLQHQKNTCRIICLLASRFAMAIEKPDKHLHLGFDGVFNANVFSVLAVHIESKIIFFYE